MALIGAVRLYQWCVSPWLSAFGGCRFTPTCSRYAIEALRTHGAFRGSLMTFARVARCHPFYPGGYDPVPMVPPSLTELFFPRHAASRRERDRD